MSFEKLGLSESSLNAVRRKGFKRPTDIQREVIPRLLEGNKDIIGQSQTGTGKTAAFALPLIELIEEDIKDVQAIVITPTRELAIQVADEIRSLRGEKRIYVLPVYGGQPIGPQIKSLRKGVHIVVGTPGRVIDHIERGTLSLDGVKYFILDEADRMLDMGFIEDIERILRHTNEEKRVLMFSATIPREILRLARRYLKDYEVIRIQEKSLAPEQVEQYYLEVHPRNKFKLLCRILDDENFYGIVFCQTKKETRELAAELRAKGYKAEALNGDIPQKGRERILERFRRGKTKVLVATDVAARGIDVKDLTHVVNYSVPQNPEAYVHRIGRTGREGKKGKAVTFVAPWESPKLRDIERIARVKLKEMSHSRRQRRDVLLGAS
ncbi:MAG: ATP-dependent helicase DeaD [Thermococcaceae archaeon]|uniref:DEAD/DEAH box helicase n=1 Tax=Thermococcus bergensis TaxID=2689387 RepID=UPI0007485140|nr:DEAD/DEAH box helicase [Thermococcus bergensis]KUJ98951.1 MAG: ATP-dependent RNA helicase, DEAD-family protein [Thermococcales archaeon 44_46]MDK2782699.1 ATP-dependent helicase DeaD [Thermococcaceae archaeon]MCA6214806.1 DEAD/DEAH box helicase [Thermococcus bergensis]MDK2854496.1 ATP-dependent helicase DeaD [Thermococcaceae archaeon]MDN5320254.1 ATP-dependent helicase DeaD [Thermococcaceae archaeon]